MLLSLVMKLLHLCYTQTIQLDRLLLPEITRAKIFTACKTTAAIPLVNLPENYTTISQLAIQHTHTPVTNQNLMTFKDI